MNGILERLRSIVSERFVKDDVYTRHAYSRNVDPVLQGVPDYVVRPRDAREVSEVMKLANELDVPVTVRGGGDCEFGGSKPVGDGGILIDMKRMDGVINIDQDNLVATVEAGISWGKLNEQLSRLGFYTGCMGPGSGMTASVGGGISHHSVGGGGCARYGACTNGLVGLEVVLPTGEIIETGSRANKHAAAPFNRFGNGPDLAGLFCGDNGILGVKTKVSLRVYPRPPCAAYKTFVMGRKSAEAAASIFAAIRHKGIDVYDAMYIMDLVVLVGSEKGLYPLWESLKKKRGIFFYTVEANSDAELDAKVKQLDDVVLTQKCEALGQEIADGNYAKWHYVEQGGWQTYHNLWGIERGGYEPLTAECFVPASKFPAILEDLDAWDGEHVQDIETILKTCGTRPVTGSGPVLLVDGCNVELTCGFTTFNAYFNGSYHPEVAEANLRLWKSILERVTSHGAQWYMMGDITSRLMVDIGAYAPGYLAALRAVKDCLDPRHVLGRGKFNFWGVPGR
ncbi:MAG: FAD-binding oxidoreductase [Candidatus Lokiarchaeota archaeon]|nr:FAD-binding oxidoreductase [Candidatus Lokiarchaeota archaeon]